MTPAELVESLRERGVVLVPAQDGRLRYHPKAAVPETERIVLARHRDQIIAMLAADPVGWRAAVMVRQALRTASMPFLLARPGLRFTPESCASCGDPRPVDRYRCAPCEDAAVRALAGVAAAAERA
jgi:hypothetical protein